MSIIHISPLEKRLVLRLREEQFEYAQGEYFLEGLATIPDIRDYFVHFSNHSQGSFEDNSLFVFSGINRSIQVKEINKEFLPYDYPPERGGLTDMRKPNFQMDEEGLKVISFWTPSNKHLGYVFPEKNFLNLADITHSRHGVELFKNIVVYCIEKGYIKKVRNYVKGDDQVDSKLKRLAETFKLGADPEFEYLYQGEVRDLRNTQTAYFLHRNGKVGVDGAGHQLEMRPDPGLNPEEFVSNMRKLFLENVTRRTHLSSVGDEYPLGGHLHVGFGYSVEPPASLVKLLDFYIGKPTLKMDGKARGSYGQLSKFRPQPHGFEYRTPPSAIFAHPRMTYVTTKILYTVIKKYLLGYAFLVPDREVKKEDLLRLGLTKQEATFFFSFIKSFSKMKYDYNVAGFWAPEKFKTKVKIPFANLKFVGNWSEKSAKDEIKKIYNEIKIKGKESVRIMIGGHTRDIHTFNNRHKAISGFSCEGWQRVAHEEVLVRALETDDTDLAFGITIAYTGHQMYNREEKQNLLLAFKEALIEQINKKLEERK
jgi:hypothetical protein